jgi:hypothetical protein
MQVTLDIPDGSVQAVLSKLEANWALRASRIIQGEVSYGTFGTADRIRSCLAAYIDSLLEQYEHEERLKAMQPAASPGLPKATEAIVAEKLEAGRGGMKPAP